MSTLNVNSIQTAGGASPVLTADIAKKSDLVAASGASLVGYQRAGAVVAAIGDGRDTLRNAEISKTIEKKASETVSVKDFGAVGDGITDDTVAIQNAINYVRSQPNGELYFPPSSPSQYYKITAPLLCNGSIKIVGAGPNSAIILAVGLSAGQYILDFDNANPTGYYFQLQDITLRSNNGSPNAIRIREASYFLMKNVQLYTVFHGIVITGTTCFTNNFEQVSGYNIGGSTVKFTNFTGGGNYKFDTCTFTGDYGFIFDNASGVNQMVFLGCNFEQCVTNSFRCDGTIQGLSFLGCRTEGCNGPDFVIYPSAVNEVTGLTVTGCYFTTDVGASVPIVLGGAGGKVRGFSITGNHVEYAASAYFVQLNGEGESGVVSGNYFNLTTTLPTNVQRPGVVVFANENATGKCNEYWGAEKWGVASGTWTPVDASGAGLTLTLGDGEYMKIGSMLHWRAFVRYPVTADTSNAAIGGLLHAMSTEGQTSRARAGASVDSHNVGIDVGIRQFILNSTSFSFVDPLNNGTFRTNANLSGKDLEMSGFYKIA